MSDFLPTEGRKNLAYQWPAIGNDKAIEFLDKALHHERLSQAYIFIGPPEIGKLTVALAFSKNIQREISGFNTDLHILEAESGKQKISIAQVREFIKVLDLSSFSGGYKIGIIKQADNLSEEAKSALLKTLEEPKEKVIIILLAESEDNFPATILSRCQKIYFYPVSTDLIYDYLVEHLKANRLEAKNLAALAAGRPLRAIRYFEDKNLYQEYTKKTELILDMLLMTINDRLAVVEKLMPDKSYGPAALDRAREIILIIEGLTRDMLLLDFNQAPYLRNVFMIEHLKKVLDSFSPSVDERVFKAKHCLAIATRALNYLDGAVNPRLVIEQLAIDL